jgi:hypothetical protein
LETRRLESPHGHSRFIKDATYIAIFVDDLLNLNPDIPKPNEVKGLMKSEFEWDDLGSESSTRALPETRAHT